LFIIPVYKSLPLLWIYIEYSINKTACLAGDGVGDRELALDDEAVEGVGVRVVEGQVPAQ
jgi:hypothetical protein